MSLESSQGTIHGDLCAALVPGPTLQPALMPWNFYISRHFLLICTLLEFRVSKQNGRKLCLKSVISIGRRRASSGMRFSDTTHRGAIAIFWSARSSLCLTARLSLLIKIKSALLHGTLSCQSLFTPNS